MPFMSTVMVVTTMVGPSFRGLHSFTFQLNLSRV